MELFTQELKVKEEHLDQNNHINSLVYLQWALNISKDHWLAKISEEVDEKYFWMVRSHRVEYKKQAFLGDELAIQTYVKGFWGPFSDRMVRIYNKTELVSEIESNWCLIERATQKPKRIPKTIEFLFK